MSKGSGLGAKMAGGNPANGRQANEFYPTPADVTEALILAEGDRIPQRVWEPACGTGSMSEVFADASFDVESSDIVNHGYGVAGVDFLHKNTVNPFGKVKYGIITNPPFVAASHFVTAAHGHGASYLALVLKSTFFHAWKSRGPLWEQYRPARIYALGWRPDFLGQGAPTMEVMWCVWEPGKTVTQTTYDILPPMRKKTLDRRPKQAL